MPVAKQPYPLALARDQYPVHLHHCFYGEYEHGCKYGQIDVCPAAPAKRAELLKEFATKDITKIDEIELGMFQRLLKFESDARAAVKAAEEKAVRIAFNRVLYTNKSLFLSLLKHDRSSCSDENPSNAYTTEGRGGYPRCNKCALMNLEEYNLEDFEINLTVTVKVGE